MTFTRHRCDWLSSDDFLNLARCAHERSIDVLPFAQPIPEAAERRWLGEKLTLRLWSERLARDLNFLPR